MIVLHEGTEPGAALAPWRGELGTIAMENGDETDVAARPDLARSLGLRALPPARVCRVGEMQVPPASRRYHDGIDVLQELWRAAEAGRS